MPSASIVVCDDEELIRWSLSEHLQQEGFRTFPVANGKEALDAVRDQAPALVVMDLKMPVMDGLTTLRKLRESGNDTPVIVITAHGAVDSAIEATRLGAVAYLTKPFDLREVTLAVRRALDDARLRHEVHYLRTKERTGYGDFVGSSPALQPVFDLLRRLETVDATTVLIQGESGTGKDLIARSIHGRGPRRNGPFMEIDCAAMPEQLIESQLFGHERGAFTDARNTKPGLFEVANGGVVFLDEIGEMTQGTQAKLLRALENRTFKRVGGVANIAMDVAVVAATNRDLREEVKKGHFREDLFFRLNVVPLMLPSLRERSTDVATLASFFLDKFNRTFSRRVRGISGSALELMQAYSWPGNVRELRNVLERVVILNNEEVITPEMLPPEIRFARGAAVGHTSGCPFTLPEGGVDLEAVERGLLTQALARTSGNQSAAARLLGISRYALRYRMEKFNLVGTGE